MNITEETMIEIKELLEKKNLSKEWTFLGILCCQETGETLTVTHNNRYPGSLGYPVMMLNRMVYSEKVELVELKHEKKS